MTAIAEHEWTAPDPGGACPAQIEIAMPGFVVPAVDPQSRRQVIIILIVQAMLPEEGEVTLTPVNRDRVGGAAVPRITAAAAARSAAGLDSAGQPVR